MPHDLPRLSLHDSQQLSRYLRKITSGAGKSRRPPQHAGNGDLLIAGNSNGSVLINLDDIFKYRLHRGHLSLIGGEEFIFKSLLRLHVAFLPAAEGYPAVRCQFPRRRAHRSPSPTPTSWANSITAHQRLARCRARALLIAASRARGRLSAKTAAAPPRPVNKANPRNPAVLLLEIIHMHEYGNLWRKERSVIVAFLPVNSAQPLLPGRHEHSSQPKIPSEEKGVKKFGVQERLTRR